MNVASIINIKKEYINNIYFLRRFHLSDVHLATVKFNVVFIIRSYVLKNDLKQIELF